MLIAKQRLCSHVTSLNGQYACLALYLSLIVGNCAIANAAGGFPKSDAVVIPSCCEHHRRHAARKILETKNAVC